MEKQSKESQNSLKPNKDEGQPLSFLKFSGMGFEMLGFIVIGYWLGSKLDEYFQFDYTLTLVGILLGIAGALINLFRKLPKN